MGLSTHVLDTMHGCPALNMHVTLYKVQANICAPIKSLKLNADGRSPDGPLLDSKSLEIGQYRLAFQVKEYFSSKGVLLQEPTFLDVVNIDFGVAQPNQNYHVPLLVSPWSYSTYRGS